MNYEEDGVTQITLKKDRYPLRLMDLSVELGVSVSDIYSEFDWEWPKRKGLTVVTDEAMEKQIRERFEIDKAMFDDTAPAPWPSPDCTATTKPTNPKDAIGSQKAPVSCVPLPVVMEMGLAMLEGACKYGRHNYRDIGVRASVYFDAACRHLFAWWEGEDDDPDSGQPHIVKALACLAVIRDAQNNGKCTDDRPPPCPIGWVAQLNDRAKEMLKRFPDPLPPHLATAGLAVAPAIFDGDKEVA